jgi:hypothetical protein
VTDLAPILSSLAQLAEGHLATMKEVSWEAFAKSIALSAPLPAGATLGCEVEGRSYDVGDRADWLGIPNGNIQLRCHATTYFKDFEGASAQVERSLEILKPDRTRQ